MIGLKSPCLAGDATSPAFGAGARRLSLEVSGLYLALYLHFGFFAFLPLWLAKMGAAPGEVGILMAIPLVLRLVTVAPFSAWAGQHGRVRDAIMATALFSSALVALLITEPGHAGRIAIVVVFSILWDQTPVLTDAYAVMAARARGLDFGRMRVWGSIGAVVSSVCAGWTFGVLGIRVLPLVVAGLLLLPVMAAALVPSDRQMAHVGAARGGSWRDVLADRPLVLAMAASALVMASHGVLTSFGAIQWSARGIGIGTIGLLQACAVSAEIAAFWFGSKLLGNRDPRWMIWIAACFAVVRWIVMATDPGAAPLFVVQLLQGMTSTGAILGSMLVIARRVPVQSSAAAQGLNAVLLGLALSATTAGSGWLWPHGPAFAYLAMAILAAFAGVVAWPRPSWRDCVAPTIDPGTVNASPERS